MTTAIHGQTGATAKYNIYGMMLFEEIQIDHFTTAIHGQTGATAKYNIYGMMLFEEIQIDHFTSILRVPGGWILHKSERKYGPNSSSSPELITSTFVPYNNEFQQIETLSDRLG
jgi:hypothetical protein